jgi:hypothetical protein
MQRKLSIINHYRNNMLLGHCRFEPHFIVLYELVDKKLLNPASRFNRVRTYRLVDQVKNLI